MARWLLERLEKSDLGVLGEIRGVVDDDHAPTSFERAKSEILLHEADLLDRDVLVVALLTRLIDEPRHEKDVRMRSALDLPAGQARAAPARHNRRRGGPPAPRASRGGDAAR